MTIKAGVIYKTKFVTSSNAKAFKGYLDYQSRQSAENKEELTEKQFIFSAQKYPEELSLEEEIKNYKKMAADNYAGYIEYMDNKKKYANIFTDTQDRLTDEEKKELGDLYTTGQNNGSVLWQNIISFDSQWLKDVGILKDGILDERTIMLATRASTNRLLDREDLKTAIWCASIHHNTDNYHVHISIVEPFPIREKKIINGSEEIKGYMLKKNILQAKSLVVNTILNSSEQNQKINEIMRKQIIGSTNKKLFRSNRELNRMYNDLYSKLPDNTQQWFYNKNAMSTFKNDIDDITKEYILVYHQNDYNDLKERLHKQERIYKTAYGSSKNDYTANKIDDLFSRMGNAILAEMRADKKIEKQRRYMEKGINQQAGFSGTNKYHFINALNTMQKISKTLDNEYKKAQAQIEYEMMIEKQMNTGITL